MSTRAAHERPRPRRGRPVRPVASRAHSAPTRARLLALRVLERVQRAGAYADVLLSNTLARSGLSAGDRAFATDLVYGTLRWRGRIDFQLRRLLDRDLGKLEPLVATALRLGAYQILFAERVPDSAAVDESVRCIRAAGVERASGLVNAVLRRLASEHARMPLPALEEDALLHLVHALSLPEWLAERWLALYGPESAAALARACNQIPPLSVRANIQQVSAADLLDELRGRFPEARRCRYARDGLVLGRRGNPALDPAFLAGRFTVQDEGSQLVVSLLDPQPGERVLDACAAPGGKATALAERVGKHGSVLALDRHAGRLDLLRRTTRRLHLGTLECQQRDATQPLADLANDGGFERVLVDAPCSGLGTLRRNPDARWRVGPRDPSRLAETQRAILQRAAEVLKPGGILVYATCTLLPEENEAVVESFLEQSGEFALATPLELPAELRDLVDANGYLRCLPHLHDTDGFFAARMERRS